MAKSGTTQPKADQPRVSTESLKRTEAGPSLQYRVEGVRTLSKPTKTRDMSRMTRG